MTLDSDEDLNKTSPKTRGRGRGSKGGRGSRGGRGRGKSNEKDASVAKVLV